MKTTLKIISLFLFLTLQTKAQETETTTFRFKGQFSSLAHFNQNNELPLLFGGRYIPQVNYTLPLRNKHLLDFEYSANIFGNAALKPFTDVDYSGKIKNYRAWIRYSGNQFEIRAGLQKINFGSATILRPLMWFDQLDPRDPLQLTDGVWGILARYYFMNNANIWVWGLYGNKNPRGWEIAKTSLHTPEFGGRFQLPAPKGEIAFSYHHRFASTLGLNELIPEFDRIEENRFGFDARFDMAVGWWIETSWTHKNANLGLFKNQQIINAGIDYTFNIANGLYMICEQLLASNSIKSFEFKNPITFSLASFSYPVGMFDNVNAIFYYDWTSKKTYNFINWQKQFDTISLHLIAYWNPKEFKVPTQNTGQNLYGGKGVLFMFVFNH